MGTKLYPSARPTSSVEDRGYRVMVRPKGELVFGIAAIIAAALIVLGAVFGAVTAWLTIGASLAVIAWLVYRWWQNAKAWSRLEDESRRDE
jgi:fatty acid desaturase